MISNVFKNFFYHNYLKILETNLSDNTVYIPNYINDTIIISQN